MFTENNFLDLLFLPIIFFIGAVTSWEDYRSGKIRNKWIKLGFYYGLAMFTLLFAFSLFTNIGTFILPFAYLKDVLYNSLLAIVLGYWLWKMKLISAGDAKLFFVFSFLLPLKYYWGSYLHIFPSFVLAVNILLPVFFFIMIQAAVFWIKGIFLKPAPETGPGKQKKESLLIGLVSFFKVFAVFFAIILLVSKLRAFITPHTPPYIDPSLIFVGIFLLYRSLGSWIRKNPLLVYLSVLAAILYLLNGFLNADAELIGDFKYSLFITFIFLSAFSLLNRFFSGYIARATVIKIEPDKLRAGMRVAEENEFTKSHKLKGDLDERSLEEIKIWAREEKRGVVKIYKKNFFAVWIFLGVIITIIFQKSLMSMIIDLF